MLRAANHRRRPRRADRRELRLGLELLSRRLRLGPGRTPPCCMCRPDFERLPFLPGLGETPGPESSDELTIIVSRVAPQGDDGPMTSLGQTLKGAGLSETLEEAAPCDDCRLRRRCATELLACVRYSFFSQGFTPDRWRGAPLEPTRWRYEKHFGRVNSASSGRAA